LIFYETDNDQKTLGTLRDNISHIKAYIEDKDDKLKYASELMKSRINKIPLGSRKYHYANELMKLEIEK
jgi:hypothetical protein